MSLVYYPHNILSVDSPVEYIGLIYSRHYNCLVHVQRLNEDAGKHHLLATLVGEQVLEYDCTLYLLGLKLVASKPGIL